MSDTSSARSACPGCGGCGTVVALNTVMACGRCHGQGSVDLVAEQTERARQAEELIEDVLAEALAPTQRWKLEARSITSKETSS
jgi:hypothetical protein